MPNFDKPLEMLETRLDKWLYFIKNLEDLQSIPELFKTEEAFLSAFEAAKLANLEPSERDQYQQSLKIMRDNYSAFQSAQEIGEAIGEARGREAGLLEREAIGREAGLLEGEAKGREAINLETAKKMKAAGMSADLIKTITGLSDADLENL
jgi:predicted transposase/invertase (TIGR01784 family)